ncbi:MAG TPA: hypothetical protein VHX49_07395 [Candidatus Acidoferrales bacterium]|nr:hypothetical protein [Candidatus Acidoferrales bacterium]
MDDAAFLFGLGAGVHEKEALAAHRGSFEDEEAAVFAGVDRVDLFVERLLIYTGAVDEHGDDVRVAQARAKICAARVVCVCGVDCVDRWSDAVARPFLLRLF